jgi:hypothetical protein
MAAGRKIKGLSSMSSYGPFTVFVFESGMRILRDLADIRHFGLSSAALGFLLAATGLTVWTGLSVWAGLGDGEPGFRLREAWDTPAYLYLGLPAMALAVALAGFHIPERAWRWPVCLVAGHQAGVLLIGVGMQSGLSLLLLTLVLAILLATVFAVPALVGSVVARRRDQRVF